jgi:hypothetical protein
MFLHVKYLLFLSDFNETRISSTDLKKKFSNIDFSEIFSIVGVELYGDGQTDMTKLDLPETVHRDTIMKVTNKMQLYRLIYYS